MTMGGVDIPPQMSAEERRDLLTFENELAGERDAKAREFQLESERRREGQEREIRKQTELTEQQRIAELEAMEQAGIDAAPSEYDASLLDQENAVTNMWSSLGQGTSPNIAPNTTPDVTTDRPE
jgi:regulator of protease activity HflC (stomatin/prohibitin superfamily)